MYRPAAFAVDDMARLHAVIREHVIATVAVVRDGAIDFAYAPAVLDSKRGALGAVRFHLARANPLAAMEDGTRVTLSFLGPDAYISPDWYETLGRVPTWNYIAVEGFGIARKLNDAELRQQLVDLSAHAEAKLAPKPPWTIDKVPAAKLAGLLNAIVGFEIVFERLEGKFKLSQNVTPEDRVGTVRGLEARGDGHSLAMAGAMRGTAT